MKQAAPAAMLLLAACAHVDTGQVDYRIADIPSQPLNRNLSDIDADNESAKYCAADVEQRCDPILPARVVRRYMPDPETGWRAFRDTQIYSIEIEQGIIGSNILEGNILGREFGVRRQNIWHNSRRRFAECGPRLGLMFRRRACGVASADVRVSFA